MPRWLPYVLSPLLFMLALEILAWAVNAQTDYRGKLLNLLDQLQVRDQPPEPEPLPGNLVVMRRGNDRPQLEPYTIGGKVIKNATTRSRSIRTMPSMLPDDGKPRAFVIGGSAAYGFPYAWNESFSVLLEKKLREEGHETHVYNCGYPGKPSAYFLPVVRLLVDDYKADTLIIFSGNNEWVWWVMPMQARFGETRLRFWRGLSTSRAMAAVQYWILRRAVKNQDAIRHEQDRWHIHHEINGYRYALDYPAETQTQFDPTTWPTTKARFLDQYQKNLRQIVDHAHSKKVRVIMMTIPFNYRISPAWKHPQPIAIDPSKREAMTQHTQAAATLIESQQYENALIEAQHAIDTDPLSPLAYYLRGVCLEKLGRPREAEVAYANCREHMVGDFGSLLSINQRIADVAKSRDTELLDVRQLFDDHQHAAGRYFNDLLIDDDCHPTPLGHQLIADALAQMMLQPPPPSDLAP